MSFEGLTSSEKRKAASLLHEYIAIDDLEALLSGEDLYLAFRSELTSLDQSERKQFLSRVLIEVFGDRLFNSVLIRERLAPDQANLKSWRPGTASAIEFVRSVGLPEVFAGTLPPPRPSSTEIIRPDPGLPPLVDYQEETIESALALSGPGKRLLVSLPTGAGKTRVACELITRLHKKNSSSHTTLWIAQSEELCEQAAACIEDIWMHRVVEEPLSLYRAWSSHLRKQLSGMIDFGTRSSEHSFVVATPAGAEKLLTQKVPGALGESLQHLGSVIIDEAHRAAASTYKSILRALEARHRKLEFIAGLSATPIRETYASNPFAGTESLAELFPILVEPVESLGTKESPTTVLQNREILAKLRFKTVNLQNPFLRNLVDYTFKQVPKVSTDPAIAYLPTVADAKYFAVRLRSENVAAEFVSGSTPIAERLRITKGIRSGAIQILANCDLLTTGFDAPSVKQIFLARNTRSPVLYKQIVGRGLRGPKFGGSEYCDVHLCNINLEFDNDPNTAEFARGIWSARNGQ